MTAETAHKLYDALLAEGFVAAINCSVAPVGGYVTRGKRAGEARIADDSWRVSVTPLSPEDDARIRAALRGFEWSSENVAYADRTYTFHGMELAS